MLSLPSPSVYQSSKCTVTHGQMPHLAADHTPSKHKPWSALLAQDFVHRVDLLLPEETFLSLEPSLAGLAPPAHFRVTAPLGRVLEGDFFTGSVKTGMRPLLIYPPRP